MADATYHRKKRIERQSKGLCSLCDIPVSDGFKMCEKHRELHRNYKKKYRDTPGRCRNCNAEKPIDEFSRCERCRDKRKKQRERGVKKRMANGVCPRCGIEMEEIIKLTGKKQCSSCLEYRARYESIRRGN
jgi:hypothetical protein